MDYAACYVVYVDHNACNDRLFTKDDEDLLLQSHLEELHLDDGERVDGLAIDKSANKLLHENIGTLLQTFGGVYVCKTGKACLEKVTELTTNSKRGNLIPTLVLIDVPEDDVLDLSRQLVDERASSPPPEQKGPAHTNGENEDLYGSRLLQHIAAEVKEEKMSKLVIPVVVMSFPKHEARSNKIALKAALRHMEADLFIPAPKKRATIKIPVEQQLAVPYIDIGAVDVLGNPIQPLRLPGLTVHIYRIYKEFIGGKQSLQEKSRQRKRSWVGLGDSKPYSYLREAMVSGLMDGICSLSSETFASVPVNIQISEPRQLEITEALASWSFSAHDFSDDELLMGASMMLEHALAMPELEPWRIPTESLHNFLAACRSAYNSFVPYHNFRHVIDVLQAVFYFLVQLGTLPAYPPDPIATLSEASASDAQQTYPIPALLGPFDALTLLITAIGHDVGHPGVNNAFLVTLNAPLAQLYNDRSVLESFHCAAYSQILRRHWPSVFGGIEMRQLMISSILATDMGLHFDYMKKLGWLQEKLHENGGTQGWNGRVVQEYRTLACSLLIKCADISNVARTFDVAARWTMILTDEFSRQASMETDLGIPTALFAPPVRETIELGQSQIGFINIFAFPLFQGVADIMPAMAFCVDELIKNKRCWEDRVSAEQMRIKAGGKRQGERKDSDDRGGSRTKPRDIDGMYSPRQLSLASTGRQGSTSNQSGIGTSGVGSAAGGVSNDTSSKHTTAPATPSNLRHDSYTSYHLTRGRDSSIPRSDSVPRPGAAPRSDSTRSESVARGEEPEKFVSKFDNPTPTREDEQPYHSATIPIGDDEMERLERSADSPFHTVQGVLQRNIRDASSGILEFPRPVSSGRASSNSRLLESKRSSKQTGYTTDGAQDGVTNATSSTTNNTNSSTPRHSTTDGHLDIPRNGTLKAATSSPDLRVTKVRSPPMGGHKPRPDTAAGAVLNGKASTVNVGEIARDKDDGAKRESIVTTMRNLTRKKSSRGFRFWRKKTSGEVDEVPLPVATGLSERHSSAV